MNFEQEALLERMDLIHANVCAGMRELFRAIARAGVYDDWRREGARSLVHLIRMRYGLTEGVARRWVQAAHALEGLPVIARAFESGVLSVDKVVELTRFATVEDEGELVGWACTQAVGTLRRRAEAEERRRSEELQESQTHRWCSDYYYTAENGQKRFHLELDTPASEGPAIRRKLDAEAKAVPELPSEEGRDGQLARRADAAVRLLSGTGTPGGVNTEVVIFAHVSELERKDGTAQVMRGPVIPVEEARVALCDGSFRTLLLSDDGVPLKMGRSRRLATNNQMKALWLRDGGAAPSRTAGTPGTWSAITHRRTPQEAGPTWMPWALPVRSTTTWSTSTAGG